MSKTFKPVKIGSTIFHAGTDYETIIQCAYRNYHSDIDYSAKTAEKYDQLEKILSKCIEIIQEKRGD